MPQTSMSPSAEDRVQQASDLLYDLIADPELEEAMPGRVRDALYDLHSDLSDLVAGRLRD